MSVEVRHLRYFLAVAEELHFGRAAARMHVAQPAISQQIKRLEEEIGTELFFRNRREVRLAPAGEALRRYAERAVADVDGGVEAARLASAGIVGTLAIGFVETAAGSVVPQAVRRFRAHRPEVQLTLRELGVGEQIEQLRSERLDIGLIRPPFDREGITAELVVEEELVAAVPSAQAPAGASRLTMRALLEMPLVLLAREVVPGLYDQVLAIREEEGGTGSVSHEATSIQAVLGLDAADFGASLLPASVRSLSREGVEFVAVESAARSPLLLVRRDDDPSPLVEAFSAAAHEAVRP
jgi:DNA-binding transcriptional LysR family regulator